MTEIAGMIRKSPWKINDCLQYPLGKKTTYCTIYKSLGHVLTSCRSEVYLKLRILLALIPFKPGDFANPLDVSWYWKTWGIGHRNHQTNTEHLVVFHLLVSKPRGFLITTKSLHCVEPQALIRDFVNVSYITFLKLPLIFSSRPIAEKGE